MSDIQYIHQIGLDPYYKTWHTSGRGMLMYMHSDGGSIVSTQRNYPIKKGALCFIGGNHFHYTLPENPDSYNRTKLFMTTEVLGGVLALFPPELRMADVFSPNSLVYAQLEETERQHIEQVLDSIDHYGDDSRYLDPIVKSAYMALLVCLHKNQTDITADTSNMIQRAVEYINQHISEDICLDALCREIHISKYHFSRKFKEITGFPVMGYVLKTRIVAAKGMLSETNLPISEVSSRNGFSSVSYFCRVFKEHTGITPLQYHKIHRNV